MKFVCLESVLVGPAVTFRWDVAVSDIRQIGENLIVPAGVRPVDAYGQLVIPGGIDANTNLHAAQKGLNPVDNFYQGTRAALSGGTTTISQLSPIICQYRSIKVQV